MNKKIKQLAEQAGITANNLSDGDMSQADLEKFAKLLVQECITAIKNDDRYHLSVRTIDDRYNQGVQMGLEFAITDIAEHFGVELCYNKQTRKTK